MKQHRHQGIEQAGKIARALAGVWGLLFLGIGVSVLIFLWAQPFGNFGSPPLFFRIFGSFIALGFIAFGLAMAAGAFAVGRHIGSESSTPANPTTGHTQGPSTATSYTCPHCGAPLSEGADVSPKGDVKCTYCKTWFNVHSN